MVNVGPTNQTRTGGWWVERALAWWDCGGGGNVINAGGGGGVGVGVGWGGGGEGVWEAMPGGAGELGNAQVHPPEYKLSWVVGSPVKKNRTLSVKCYHMFVTNYIYNVAHIQHAISYNAMSQSYKIQPL